MTLLYLTVYFDLYKGHLNNVHFTILHILIFQLSVFSLHIFMLAMSRWRERAVLVLHEFFPFLQSLGSSRSLRKITSLDSAEAQSTTDSILMEDCSWMGLWCVFLGKEYGLMNLIQGNEARGWFLVETVFWLKQSNNLMKNYCFKKFVTQLLKTKCWYSYPPGAF